MKLALTVRGEVGERGNVAHCGAGLISGVDKISFIIHWNRKTHPTPDSFSETTYYDGMSRASRYKRQWFSIMDLRGCGKMMGSMADTDGLNIQDPSGI